MAFVSSSYKVVQRNVGVSAKDIDSNCKNKWVWDWLSEKDVNKDYLSDYVKKVANPGVAICWWCKEFLKYGSSGKKDYIVTPFKIKKNIKISYFT